MLAGGTSADVVNVGKESTYTMDVSCSRKVRISCLMVNPSPIEVVKSPTTRRGTGLTMPCSPIALDRQHVTLSDHILLPFYY